MNFKHIIHLLWVLTAFSLLSSCEKEIVQHDADMEIQQIMQEYGLPSVSTCVIKDTGIVWSRFYGFSDKQKQIEASDQTIYHIGSISKLFIVTALMQLEEKGLIDIDADVNNYLPIVFRHPAYPDVPITSRILLTHRAGLAWPQSYDGEAGMWAPFEPDKGPPPSEWVPEYLIPSGTKYDPSLWKPVKPGSHEFYSNIGTCVLAYVVEAISGQNFRDYCMDHIFVPLEMHNTSYNYADLDWDQIAVMYQTETIYTKAFDIRVYPSGGLKTTVLDLSRFAMAYMNKGILNGNRLLEESTIDKILEIQNEASGRCLIWQASFGGWVGHTGGLVLGTSTTLEIHPESKTAFIIFTNTHSSLVIPGNEMYGLIKQKANEFIGN
jgi:CubicO group peptidase (beta-lactamase class C family)